MDTQDLKKYLAGFGFAGLLAGFGLAIESGTSNAADNSAGVKGDTGVTTEQTVSESS